MRWVSALLVFLMSPAVAAAGNGPRWSPSQLSVFADLIVSGRVASVTSGWDQRVNTLYTYVTVDVTEVLKGDLAVSRITVKQLGGEADGLRLAVLDQPAFEVGEEVLLYLEARPRDGTLYTSALWQGKWTLRNGSSGRRMAVRQRPAAHPGADEVQSVNDARAAAAAVGPSRATAFMAAEADEPVSRTSSGFNLLGPFRYVHPPAVDAQQGGQPGLSGGGFAQIQSAMQRWNSAGTPFRFLQGTQTGAPRCSGAFLGNGRVTISFMDPCGEMSNSGGTLAMGGSYFTAGGGGSSNGQAFDRALEGFVINNDSSIALSYLTLPGCFEDVQTHELGHVLGLNHSTDPTALMFSSLDTACRQGPRGLVTDDINGIRFIYGTGGSPATPPTVAPTNVAVAQAPGSLTVSWSPLATPPAATQYRVDFRTGHQDSGPLVASLMASGSPLSVSVPAGVSGAFNATVIGVNSSGAGPTSARADFVIASAATACSAPPPAVTGATGAVANGFARIQWAPSAGATHYVIQAGTAQGAADLLGVTSLGLHTGAAAAVPAGFRAWVRIAAVNSCGLSTVVDYFLQ